MGMSSTLRERIHMRKMTITNALIFIRQILYFELCDIPKIILVVTALHTLQLRMSYSRVLESKRRKFVVMPLELAIWTPMSSFMHQFRVCHYNRVPLLITLGLKHSVISSTSLHIRCVPKQLSWMFLMAARQA